MERLIIEKLKEIEMNENVKIIGAFESGSRAWGFASSDSDYDVRFIYIRKKNDYLRLDEMRDVIEYQLDDVFDINGWDLKKALRLLFKSNPTLFEWCNSPIVYHETELFSKFKILLPKFFSCKKSILHYLSMAESNYRMYLKTDDVRIKKYFYVLRPLLAALWIVNKKSQPPMLFTDLVDAELDLSMKPIVDKLFQIKKEKPELSIAPKIQELNDYVEKTLNDIKGVVSKIEDDNGNEWDIMNNFFIIALDEDN